MTAGKRDLEIQEDIPFQKRVWRVERVGWGLMGLVMIGALIGIFGPGPLSHRELWDNSSKMKAEFNRIDRYQAPTTLKLSIYSTLVTGRELSIALNREFIEHIEITHIDPQPQRVESADEDFTFYFDAVSNKLASIVFHYEPNEFGKMPIRLSLSNGPTLNFEQFYFP